MRFILMAMAIVSLASCKASSGGTSGVLDESVGVGEPTEDQVAALGLWRDNRPLVKQISLDGADPLESQWNGPGGYEYWHYPTGYQAGGYGNYHPYRGSCNDESADSEVCEMQPHELAKRCMHQAGETLKWIMANPPEEWTDFLTRNRRPYFYGWIDDGASSGFSGRMHEGPFRWNSYMKWAGNVRADGTCTTPSPGQFINLIQQFDREGHFRVDQ